MDNVSEIVALLHSLDPEHRGTRAIEVECATRRGATYEAAPCAALPIWSRPGGCHSLRLDRTNAAPSDADRIAALFSRYRGGGPNTGKIGRAHV